MGRRKLNGPKSREVLIAVRKRRRRIAVLLFQHPGITQAELAVKLGVSQPCISLDIQSIYREWLQADTRKTRLKLVKRIKQNEYAAYESMVSFLRSRQDAERVTTSYTPRRCPECVGKGEKEGVQCIACGGKGKVTVEVVTREVRGQAGDPSHMRNYIEAIGRCARMEGLEPKLLGGAKNLLLNQRIDQKIVYNSIGRIDLSKLPSDVLEEARRMLGELGGKDEKMNVMEGKIA